MNVSFYYHFNNILSKTSEYIVDVSEALYSKRYHPEDKGQDCHQPNESVALSCTHMNKTCAENSYKLTKRSWKKEVTKFTFSIPSGKQ